jgi:hypothetical protein
MCDIGHTWAAPLKVISMAKVRHLLRAMKVLARDQRIPRPLRWVAGIALLPIPGPLDEAVLVLIAPLFLPYREPVREAWRSTSQ